MNQGQRLVSHLMPIRMMIAAFTGRELRPKSLNDGYETRFAASNTQRLMETMGESRSSHARLESAVRARQNQKT